MKSFPNVLSALLLVFLAYCHWQQPYWSSPVTLWPMWFWLAPGLFLAGLGWSKRTRYASAVIVVLWLVCVGVFADEPAALLRTVHASRVQKQIALHGDRYLRVVSLNCAAANANAADEVKMYHPDIVLLQESPGKAETSRLARQLFGKSAGIAWGADTSLIAGGKVRSVPVMRRLSSLMTEARVRLPGSKEIQVVSLRLRPMELRMDVWKPSYWSYMADNGRWRREQAKLVMDQIARVPDDVPVILGGDMNAPAGDAATRAFKPRLHDTFREAGTGWGGTVLNDGPTLRFDQIWVSKQFRTVLVTARKTAHSDHRMVVCDILR